MSSATAPRWRLVEGECVVCESRDVEVADTGLELAEGVRVCVCADCTSSLVATLKLESTASEALSAAHRRELQARDEMLAERDGEIVRLRGQVEGLQVAAERMRAEAERRAQAVAAIRAAAAELA